jgi:hypothetical protein
VEGKTGCNGLIMNLTEVACYYYRQLVFCGWERKRFAVEGKFKGVPEVRPEWRCEERK